MSPVKIKYFTFSTTNYYWAIVLAIYVNVFGSFAIYFPLVFKSMVYVLHTNFMKKIQGNLVQKISYLDESESSKISR